MLDITFAFLFAGGIVFTVAALYLNLGERHEPAKLNLLLSLFAALFWFILIGGVADIESVHVGFLPSNSTVTGSDMVTVVNATYTVTTHNVTTVYVNGAVPAVYHHSGGYILMGMFLALAIIMIVVIFYQIFEMAGKTATSKGASQR